jgi:hypothetical protein
MVCFFILIGHSVINCTTGLGCVTTPLPGFWFLLCSGSLELIFESGVAQVFTMWREKK